MDHFNATIQDGNFISTRRGLQVSKIKHLGTRFINASAASENRSSHQEEFSSVDQHKKQEPRFKFFDLPIESQNTSTNESCPRTRTPVLGPSSWDGTLTDNDKRLINIFLKYMPAKMYPYEQILQYNPVRKAHFLESIKTSTARLNYVLMSASGIETFLSGELTSPELVFWLSHVCSVVNDHLSDRRMGGELDEGILECVAMMAIFGYSGGRADHWNVHMNGLKQLTELHGGMQRSWGYLLNSIRRADVRGAAALGFTPHLDYHRFFEAPSKMLSPRLRTEISRDMSGILYRCGVQTTVVDAMTSTSLFAGVLRAAYSSPGREMLFDPEAFIEEWLWCEYQLVKYPAPLRSGCSSACRRLPDKLYMAADLGSSEAVAEVMVETLRAQPVPPLVGNLLESALRAAAIVYIEVLVPDEPGSPLAHAILLNLLSTSVQTIVQCLQERQSKTRNEKPRENSCDDDDDDDCLPSTATSKPVLIWICIVGFVVSKLYETDLAARGILFDRACYGQCVAMIVGPEPEDVDRLRDDDLALCRVLDARGLRIQPCDERIILKGLLKEHLYGVPALDLTPV